MHPQPPIPDFHKGEPKSSPWGEEGEQDGVRAGSRRMPETSPHPSPGVCHHHERHLGLTDLISFHHPPIFFSRA